MAQATTEPEPLHPRLQARADQLAGRLAQQNRRVYRQALAAHAAALGAKTPRHVQSTSVKEAISERARVSAESITATAANARRHFYEQTGDLAAARDLYRAWTQRQADVVAQYEASMTAARAATDFVARNADYITGEEWIEPQDAASEDECAEAIAQGRQPLGTFDAPYHVRCPHYVARELKLSGSADDLWVGGYDDDGD